MSSPFPVSTINRRICTIVPKGSGGGVATTTSISTTSSSTLTSISSSSSALTSATTISTSTISSTSLASSSTLETIPNPAVPDTFINVPAPSTSTSTTSEILTTSTSASGVASSVLSTPSEIISSSTESTNPAATGQFGSSNPATDVATGTGSNNASGGAISTQTTVAVAGGVIGGLALLSIIAFLFWFWRKRLMKKRRSTILTPLNTDSPYRRGDMGPYVFSRTSLGPTSIPEKMRAAVGYNYSKFRGRVSGLVYRSPKPSVDLNRGNSQFGLPDTPATRSTSGAGMANNDATTLKGRLVDWWGRLTENGGFASKFRNGSKNEQTNNDTYTSISNTARTGRRGSQPNFLGLLSMEEKQQRGSNSNPRRSQSLGNDPLLGSLGLNFDTENPFADSNAMSHDSAKVMPLAVSAGATGNPFSDANAIPAPAKSANNNSSTAGGPATYVQNIRRSRGYSTSAANSQLPSGVRASRMPSVYRDSIISIDTTDTRRNKFRSDPFDLDRPELLAQSSAASPQGAVDSGRDSRYGRQSNGRGLPNRPRPTHTRTESIGSRYSSGVSSLGEWSDPGPDVGPAAGRWVPSPDSMLGRQPSVRDGGSGNKRNVGKAI
ncbi:hypothetical protein F5B22DRAFT_97209 [Xylaria bambusicola]|uniref:uncharacterized protein n=1 Tax=Xylaria bambusicola TaxID=326684 RepID=UPI0020085738|nr:uncharacterized protein F5B22DRAFT_97209 [Xylaria bambusicola]KAI0517742.1 hypothetical protein F5B22DRAFT_97209 [Xylaria bambusicola]